MTDQIKSARPTLSWMHFLATTLLLLMLSCPTACFAADDTSSQDSPRQTASAVPAESSSTPAPPKKFTRQEIKQFGEETLPGGVFGPAPSRRKPPLDEVDNLLEIQPENLTEDCQVKVYIRCNHMNRPVESCTAYPYPVIPPTPKAPPSFLPMTRKATKQFLLMSCYALRAPDSKPYQLFGWRWEEALDAALARHGGMVPHSLISVYSWCDEMAPYMLPECKRINLREKARQDRFKQVTLEAQAQHDELDNEAARKGIWPHDFKMYLNREGRVKLSPGTWWIVCSHKVPGLLYYWQQPVTLTSGQTLSLEFTEDNALLIDYGW